jgi:hypothetical protein
MAKFMKWTYDSYAYIDRTHKIFYERLAKKHMHSVMVGQCRLSPG